MIRNIEQFQQNTYDLLVIGGGINGASIAHLAACRGMKVALVEKGDFASGTSSKSTKLIHGGIRYLENLEFDLVYESLRERSVQLQTAPHLVKPLEFVIPVYQGDRRPLWMMRLGVFLYDRLAGKYRIQRRKDLSIREVCNLEPGINPQGIKGGVMYYDAQMDDARLCLENVLSAAEYGAHVANYVEALSFIKENGRAVGVKVHDLLGDESFEIRARKIICAAGPWTNELLRIDHSYAKKKVRMTKGIHIVYKGKITQHALLITSKSDKRIFFVIPWMGNSLIGTTDTNYIGDPDDVSVGKEDVDYLIAEAKRVFPGLDFGPDKIVATFAGLRPLIRRGGSPTKVSRKHLFHKTVSGIIFVVGGKYTTYRKIAEDCLDKIAKTAYRPPFRLYGGGTIRENPHVVAEHYGLEVPIIQALMEKYGTRYQDVLKLVESDPHGHEKLSEDPPVIMAQVVYSVKVEMARTVQDIVERRLGLCYSPAVPEKCLKTIDEYLQRISEE